jgi:hypothetical protein
VDQQPVRFVASTPRMQTWVYVCIYGSLVVLVAAFGVMFVNHSAIPIAWGVLVVLAVVSIPAGLFAARRWGSTKTIPITVTTDGITLDQRPGKQFPFADAQLGQWAFTGQSYVLSGTALHLIGGSYGFVLGGKDHRVSAATRFEAPRTARVDGWLTAAEFDEVLAVAARSSGLDVRPPAAGERLRCLLFANQSNAGVMSAARNQRRQPQPKFAIDVGTDGVRVLDPSTNALLASASLAQVTVMPAIHKVNTDHGWHIQPVLVVRVPGLQPLTISCPRGWRGKVAEEKKEPEFMVSEADWRLLVDRLGLAERVAEKG